jgi:hypothetical protein
MSWGQPIVQFEVGPPNFHILLVRSQGLRYGI